jgi:hypothetical protein
VVTWAEDLLNLFIDHVIVSSSNYLFLSQNLLVASIYMRMSCEVNYVMNYVLKVSIIEKVILDLVNSSSY